MSKIINPNPTKVYDSETEAVVKGSASSMLPVANLEPPSLKDSGVSGPLLQVLECR